VVQKTKPQRMPAATLQEDGEPGWRFNIRKPLLMSSS
jgi:hypothetical protein